MNDISSFPAHSSQKMPSFFTISPQKIKIIKNNNMRRFIGEGIGCLCMATEMIREGISLRELRFIALECVIKDRMYGNPAVTNGSMCQHFLHSCQRIGEIRGKRKDGKPARLVMFEVADEKAEEIVYALLNFPTARGSEEIVRKDLETCFKKKIFSETEDPVVFSEINNLDSCFQNEKKRSMSYADSCIKDWSRVIISFNRKNKETKEKEVVSTSFLEIMQDVSL